jgi:hypothetical protein
MSRTLRSLLVRAARIQARIDREQERPAPNWVTLFRLKVIRLRLKDRLRNLVLRRARRPSIGRWAEAAPKRGDLA